MRIRARSRYRRRWGRTGRSHWARTGEWTYTLDNTDEDTDALGAGEKVTDTFTVASVDGTGAQVVITVTGADDAAVIGGDSTGAVTEDDADETEASGTLTVSDPDADQSAFTVQTKVGTYGTFALGEDGEWTYTLDNTDEDTDALGAGQKETERFTVTSVGGTTAQVVVTVTGADDAAVIGGDSTGAVTEDADETEASGTLTVSDPDADQSEFTAQTKVGTYGTFALGEDGEWTYTLDNTDEDTDALGAGEKVTDAFEVTSVGGTTAQVVVTVTGADDAAVIGGDSTGAVTEDADETEASGTLTVSDPDADQSAFTVQTKVGTYGTFALGEDGEWTYTLDNTDEDTDALGAGEKVTDTFEVTSVGGTTAQVVVTVTGADDAAVIGGDSTGAVTEDADETEASGTLTVSDPDADQSAFTVQTKVGTYGTFALGEDGEWTYTLDNTDEDTDALGAGEKVTDTFEVTSVGGTTAQVVVTVTGADDAAVIGGDSTGAVTEDADETEASGTLTVSDPDADQSAFTVQTKVGTYGTFALGEDGEWTYTLDNTDEDTDALGAGEKVTDTFTVASVDGTGAQVVITVTGADDAAVIGGDSTGAVTEDDADETEASGTLTVSDPDADQSAFTVQTKVGTYGTFALGEDGEWTYTLDNTDEDTDALGAGQKETERFTVTSVDEDTDALGAGQKETERFTVTSVGGTTAQVVVTVTGADDAAVIGGDSTGAVTEDADETEASGTLTVSDPDADQSEFTAQTKVGTYGTFALGEDGEWTYTLDNTDEDTDALGAGEKVTDAFEVTSVGGTTAQVVVTVTGADDAAVIGGDSTGAVTEDADETEASGTLTVSDPDADQSAFTVQTKVGTYGTFALGEDGEWTYTLDNTDEDTDALGAGEKVTDTFEVTSVGGTTAQVEVTVTGADDAAVIGGDSTGAVTEDDASAATASGTLTVSDPDANQSAFTAQTDVVGTYGTFTLGEDGGWRYTLDNEAADTNALGSGEKVTDTFTVASVDGTTAQVVVTVTGADDAAVIGGELTGAVTEDAEETGASGTLTVSDPDAGQSAFTAQTKVGTYGTFTLGEDGGWTYTLDNEAADTDALVAGQTETDTFEVSSVGGTVSQVVVTVTGADDAAVIGGDSTGAVTEDDASAATASGTLTVSDPDANQSAFTAQTDVVGTYGTFTLGEDGGWTYTLDNADADTDALGSGETGTDTFTVASLDGTTAQVEIVVRGANEAAVIDTTPAVEPDDEPAIIPIGDPENSAPRLPFGGDIGEPDQDPVQLPDSNGDELPAPEALLTMELRHETIFKDGFMLETGKPERNELKLISYWSMDKLYGNVLYDSAGDLQNAIFFAADGTPELVKPDAATEFGLRDGGAAARFDGNKATYIAIAHDDEFEVGTGTVMFWFNADDTRGKQVLFAKDAAGPGNHLKIGLDGASLEIRMQNAADSHSIATDDIIEAGAWYHLILSFGPDGMKLYVNGVQVGENAAAVGLQDNREPIVIGGSNHLNDDQSGDLSRLRVDDSFSGRIDEVMVYGRELDDRQALYLHERDATMFADSGSVLPASASTGEDWVWDAEAPEDGDAGADDILVRASEYVPVPDVPDWLMEVHETGFDDGYASELLAGTLVGLGVQGSRRSAGRRERNDTGELMG